MQQNYQQTLPELLNIEKKSNPISKLTKNNSEEKYWPKVDQIKINPSDAQLNNRDTSLKAEGNNKAVKIVDDDKLRANKRANQISKNLISEMMNKISLKTVSEDNYPISNETVQKLLISLDEEIKALNVELGKFQNSLLLNPTNQHLKKQKEAVEKKLNQMKTIKELYHQKIEARNKISQLESKIIELKNQNKQLKIKIARGIEKIESHIHNLPCQREKQLIEEVNKYKQALDRENEMRKNLEYNIQSINLNFKRFYQEADQARKIVNQQLKEVNRKDIELKAKEEKLKYHRCEVKTDNKSMKGDHLLGTSEIFARKLTNKLSEEQNIAEIINQINLSEFEEGIRRTRTNTIKIPAGVVSKSKNNEGSASLGALNLPLGDTKPKFNLQDQIQRMRMNQTQFTKLTKKKNW